MSAEIRIADEQGRELAGGWLHSGVCGVLDAHGYLYVIHRIKAMVITGGENVYPAEASKGSAASSAPK